MMKQIFIPLYFICCFSACNNKEEKSSTETAVFSVYEKEMNDAIAKFPDSLLLKEKLIQYYRDSAAYDKAITTVNKAIQTDSLNARLWEIKATLHFENEDTLNAIKSFENAVRILPLPRYIKLLGSLYAQTKNIKALHMADALLQNKNADTDNEAFFIKGLYFSCIDEKNKAITFFDKCLSLNYTFMPAYREKAIALYDLGKYDSAINVLTKAITLQNSFDEGYYWRGRCLEKLHKPTEAINEYHTALRYSPDFLEAKEAINGLGGK